MKDVEFLINEVERYKTEMVKANNCALYGPKSDKKGITINKILYRTNED